MTTAEPKPLTSPLWGTSARTCPPVADATCDVLVIGAGVVGLTTALAAARAGAGVIVADADRIGAGTSAATPGVASVLHGTSCQVIEETHGTEAVVTYVEELTRALAFIRAEAREGAVPSRELASHAVVEDGHTAHFLHRERFAMRPAGLNPVADDAPGLPFPTRPSIRIDDALALQPRLYVEALGRAVVAAGGLVHEASRLDRLEPGSPITARFTGTDEAGRRTTAVVRADSVVLATGMPSPDLGLVGPRLLPTTVHAVAVHGATVQDAFRIVDDPLRPYVLRPGFRTGQVVVAGRAHPTGQGDEIAAVELEGWVRSHLPGAQVTHRWSYGCQRSYDGLPLVGRVGLRGSGTYVATGFGDDHIAAATAAALQVAGHITGTETRLPWSPVHQRGSASGQALSLLRLGATKLRYRIGKY
ncbi:Glycine/D-amino acid oxidase [Raineyella antarctica]|uniref:Glycine/D-amino acid oxidase n=1 Tax=Raineyella antarctica TaxID=1577474 RepID=A0A1G6GDI3_9ACTN|nr:FAD-binding oxidoreductase [Raineyella antarctica]SDB79893.1 Glycine/D-amino acid oxidase [Raineyella antarctica]